MSSHPSLRTLDAVAITISSMVGAGIFSVFALTVRTAGPGAVAAWVLVVICSLPMAYSFSDLTGVLQQSGGPYIYLKNRTNASFGLLVAWLFLLSSLGAAIGLYTSMVGMLVQLHFPLPGVLSAMTLAALTIIVMLGIHVGAHVQRWLTVLTVLILILCIGIGLWHANRHVVHATFAGGLHTVFPHGTWAVLPATFFAFWTYSGWEAVSVPSGSYQSVRQLARGMMIGSFVVGVLYIAVAVAAVVSVPNARLAAAFDPLAYVGALWSPAVVLVISWGAVVIVATSLLAWIIATASLFQAVVRDGLLPAPRRLKLHLREYHPVFAVLTAILIFGISQFPVFTAAIAASSQTALLAYGAVFATVLFDRNADWVGVMTSVKTRRMTAGGALTMAVALMLASGWQQLWPTLCLVLIGICIVGVRRRKHLVC